MNNNKIRSQPHDCAVFKLYELAVLTNGRKLTRVGGYQRPVAWNKIVFHSNPKKILKNDLKKNVS